MNSPPPSPPLELDSPPSSIPIRTNMTRHSKAAAIAAPEAQDTGKDFEYHARCPFCRIAQSYPPVHAPGDPERVAKSLDPELTDPPSRVIYSGEHVLAFLDIQPLTWGHTLVIPRRHRVKMGDLGAADGAELGRHLPLIVRAVMRAVFDRPYNSESLEVEDADYNIVQNNGPLAAQVVPHIHHHIIPRPPSHSSHPRFTHPKNPAPTPLPKITSKYHASWTMFGRGHRTDLDETDPETLQLVKRMREEIAREFERNGDGFGGNDDDDDEVDSASKRAEPTDHKPAKLKAGASSNRTLAAPLSKTRDSEETPKRKPESKSRVKFECAAEVVKSKPKPKLNGTEPKPKLTRNSVGGGGGGGGGGGAAGIGEREGVVLQGEEVRERRSSERLRAREKTKTKEGDANIDVPVEGGKKTRGVGLAKGKL